LREIRRYVAGYFAVDASFPVGNRHSFNDRDKTLTEGSAPPDDAKYTVESVFGVLFQASVQGTW
jgi:hypothetical protein